MISENQTDLDVPISQKNAAKSLGAKARWVDGRFQGWYVPAGLDLTPFAQWIPNRVGDDTDCAPIESEFESLSVFLRRIKGAIQSSVAGRYWVKAEILGVNKTRHTYLELSEHDESGREIAKARASIWSSKNQIIQRFEKETGQALAAGVSVLIQIEADFHEQYGLGLIINDIDPKFTIGEQAAKVAKIRERLIQEGLYERNKQLIEPHDFHRVAVIAPEQAAGLGDFKTVSDQLHFGGVCHFDYYAATFQGANAVDDINRCFQQIHKNIGEGFEVDAICIIRGGGDKSGLYQLNEYELAKSICLSKVPVLVGIGHERDETILDEVGNLRLATPSMVAQHIAGTIHNNVVFAKSLFQKLELYSRDNTQKAKIYADECITYIRESALRQSQAAKELIDRYQSDMRLNCGNVIIEARNQTKQLMQDLLHQDPKRIISKGYVIVRNHEENVVSDIAKATQDLTLQFRDGNLKVSIKEDGKHD